VATLQIKSPNYDSIMPYCKTKNMKELIMCERMGLGYI